MILKECLHIHQHLILSFIAAGIFSLNSYGINGALYLIIAHAIATGALFLLVGFNA